MVRTCADRPAAGASTVLTPSLAQEIAGETSAIIGLNVIITDADGIVIGSGDTVAGRHLPRGVDRGHRAHSARGPTTQQRRARCPGVRPGMTLPIVHGGVGVGTVGITGTPARVRRFGQVVKRQTEILLDEAVLLRSRMTRERILENLLRDLLDLRPRQPGGHHDQSP